MSEGVEGCRVEEGGSEGVGTRCEGRGGGREHGNERGGRAREEGGVAERVGAEGAGEGAQCSGTRSRRGTAVRKCCERAVGGGRGVSRHPQSLCTLTSTLLDGVFGRGSEEKKKEKTENEKKEKKGIERWSCVFVFFFGFL